MSLSTEALDMTETFTTLIKQGASADDIASHLDALPATTRVQEVLGTPAGLQKKLWKIVEGARELPLDTLVPSPEQTFVYELKNSLPLFTISQKRFFRSEGAEEAVGFNKTGGFETFFAGPGYFFVRPGDNGEIVFDYTRVPDSAPPDWPAARPNTGLIPGIVYGDMQDYVRAVSSNTAIGSAYQHGKARNMHFLITLAAS